MELTIDTIINDSVKICQPKSGFRFSIDAVYLSWFSRTLKNQHFIDIGSGSGVISALLVKMNRISKIDALEMQDVMHDCLQKTLTLCGLHNNVSILKYDIKKYKSSFQYDGAVCNPPYRDPNSGHLPKDETERNARFTSTMCADDVFAFCRSYLKFGAGLFMSYDADMMPSLFESAFKYGFEAKRLMPVCPDIHIKPKIILIEFRKGGKRELSFEAPLYQKINGQESEINKKILSGEWD